MKSILKHIISQYLFFNHKTCWSSYKNNCLLR